VISLVLSLLSAAGLEVLWITPAFSDKGGSGFALSVYSQVGDYPGLLENGVAMKFAGEDLRSGSTMAFEYHTGFLFLPRFPLLRPGLNIGLTTMNWKEEDGSEEWRIRPTFGGKMQVSLITFAISNVSYGIGLNLPL
jgi:hypothetical protein